MRYQKFAFVIASLVCGFGMSQSLEAKTVYKGITIPAGGVCQPSIPSMAASLVPRANGFRNEGSTAAFAICGLQLPHTTNAFAIYFWSIDGMDRDISCTATDGLPIFNQQYSAKKVTTSGGQGWLQWDDSDFNGNVGEQMHGYHSITCNLPAQMSIYAIDASYVDDVGR